MKEIWKPIYGFEGLYEVSNTGNVKSLKREVMRRDGKCFPIPERLLKGSVDTKGYLQVELKKDSKRHIFFIHRLVAMAFLKEISGKNQVNHKDGNKLNNSVANLEWVSCEENIHHAWENKLNKPFVGEMHPRHKLNEEQVRFIRANYKLRDKEFGARALAKRFGVTVTPILLIVKGKAWKHIQ